MLTPEGVAFSLKPQKINDDAGKIIELRGQGALVAMVL